MNPRVERFAELVASGLNGKQAAIKAGYSAKTAESQASRLLRNAKVKERVAALRLGSTKRTELSADKVLKEIAHVAFARMTAYMTWGIAPETGVDGKIVKDEKGRAVISPFAHWTPSASLTEEQAAAIAEVQYDTDTGKLKLKLHSKTHALEQLGRHLGLFEKDPTKLLEALLAGFDPQFAAGVREGIRQEVSAGG